MKRVSKFAAAALLALVMLPGVTTIAHAGDRGDRCSVADQDDEECKRAKPRFQTKFFSE